MKINRGKLFTFNLQQDLKFVSWKPLESQITRCWDNLVDRGMNLAWTLMTWETVVKVALISWEHETALQRCFYKKGVLTVCSKITGEHPYQSVISIKLQSNFFKIGFRHGCSPVNFLHIFKTSFPENNSRRLLLEDLSAEH